MQDTHVTIAFDIFRAVVKNRIQVSIFPFSQQKHTLLVLIRSVWIRQFQ